MKKLLSLLLVMSVVLMCFGSVSLVAFADGTDDTITIDGVDYIKISNPTEFSSKISTKPSGNFALIADINLDQETGAYTPIDTFSGTLVGANAKDTALETRTITINVSAETVGVGLFKVIKGATFKNIKTAGSINISKTTGAIGAFAGTAKTTECKFVDCENNTSINISGNSTTRLGGFVGFVSIKTTFENCFNTGNITATGTPSNCQVGGFAGEINTDSLAATNCINRATIAGGGNVGGFVGNTSKTVTLTNCANTGDITGYISVGGFIGKTSNASNISKSYNTGNIHQSNARSGSTTTYAGALVGNASGNIMTVENCYSGGTVTKTEKTTHTTTLGKIATLSSSAKATLSNTYTINKSNIDFLTKASGATGTIEMTYCYYLAETTGVESNGIKPLLEDQMKDRSEFKGFDFENTWVMTAENNDNSKYYLFPQIKGNLYYPETPTEPEPEPKPELGTQENPYKIRTPEEFTSYINANKGAGIYFILEDNISLGDKETETSYVPVDFQGVFDGNNKTITLYINNTTLTYAGLFGSVAAGSKIKNLTVDGEINTVLKKSYTGGIAGIIDTTDIDNCTNNADIIATGDNDTTAAGIYANVSAGTCNITNCVNNGNIYGEGNCGGIAGYINAGTSVYKNCVNNGYIGGSFNDTISNYNGGIVARCNRATIENCTNNGQVTGYSYAGGILGNKTSNRETIVKTCVNNGTVNAMKSFEDGGNVGGIVAQYAENATGSLTITSCNNFGATFNDNDYVVRPVISNPSANVIISECDYLAFDNTYDDGIDNTTLKTIEELSSLDLSKFFKVENNEADNGIYSSENKNYYAYKGSIINYTADGDEDYTVIEANVNDVPVTVNEGEFSFTVVGDTLVSVTFTMPERAVTEPIQFMEPYVSLDDDVLTDAAKAEIGNATRGAFFFSKFTVRESDEYGFAFSTDNVFDENDTLKAALKPTAVAVFYGNNAIKHYYMAPYIKDKDDNYTFFDEIEFTLNVEFAE